MNESKKDSFIMYTEQFELFNELTNEEAGQMIKGIFNYVKTGELPNFEGINKIAFIPIRQILDRNAEKYEEKREKMSQNGKKGGRPKLKPVEIIDEVEEEELPEEPPKETHIKAPIDLKITNTPIFPAYSVNNNKVEDGYSSLAEALKRIKPELYEKIQEKKRRAAAQSSEGA